MSGMENQIFEDGFFVVKGKLFEDNSGKKLKHLGITSKNINEFVVDEIASFKDNSQVTVNEDGEYIWKSEMNLQKKR